MARPRRAPDCFCFPPFQAVVFSLRHLHPGNWTKPAPGNIKIIYIYIRLLRLPVVPARGGAEVALGIYYKTFLIYRTCMRRAPARQVRACFVRSCCTNVVQEHDLRATPVQCNAKRRLSSHFTLHFSHPALRTAHLHFALSTSSHLKSCELFSPHLSSSHLIPSLLTCHLSKFFSTVFISSEHWSTFLISSKFVSTHLS